MAHSINLSTFKNISASNTTVLIRKLNNTSVQKNHHTQWTWTAKLTL